MFVRVGPWLNKIKKDIIMARGDRLARQWKIFQKLVTSRNGKSVRDLAENLDCHRRTVYRDLEALEAAGFPIYTENVDGKNRWFLMDSARNPMPVPFSLPELMALYFGRDTLKVLKGTVFYDSLEGLFQKIETPLPPESKKYLKNVEQSLEVGLLGQTVTGLRFEGACQTIRAGPAGVAAAGLALALPLIPYSLAIPGADLAHGTFGFGALAAWVLARDITTGAVYFRDCARCAVHYLCARESFSPPGCPICALRRRDGKNPP